MPARPPARDFDPAQARAARPAGEFFPWTECLAELAGEDEPAPCAYPSCGGCPTPCIVARLDELAVA